MTALELPPQELESKTVDSEDEVESCCLVVGGICHLAQIQESLGTKVRGETIQAITDVCKSQVNEVESEVTIRPSAAREYLAEDLSSVARTQRISSAFKYLTTLYGVTSEGSRKTRKYTINIPEFSEACQQERVLKAGTQLADKSEDNARTTIKMPANYRDIREDEASAYAYLDLLCNQLPEEEFVLEAAKIFNRTSEPSNRLVAYVSGKRAIKQLIHGSDYAHNPVKMRQVEVLSKLLTRMFYELPETVLHPSFSATSEDWRRKAACAGMPVKIFFDDLYTVDASLACKGCPVRSDCLEYALANKIGKGTWGGESERGRERILKQRRRVIAT